MRPGLCKISGLALQPLYVCKEHKENTLINNTINTVRHCGSMGMLGSYVGRFIFLVQIFFLAACAQAQQAESCAVPEEAVDVPTGVTVETNITYTETEQGSLSLDLFIPKTKQAKPTPLVIFIHGGAWKGGNRRHIGAFGREWLPLEGYTVATISYRLSGVAPFPAQLADIRAAIRWAHANAEAYNIDPDRIALMGVSAGGHLAALVATSLEQPGSVFGIAESEQELALPPLRAVVDLFGPTDLWEGEDQRLAMVGSWCGDDHPVSDLLGGPMDNKRELVELANPINFITAQSPPFYIIHGDMDPIVPYQQSLMLYEALTTAGVDATLYRVKKGGHGWGDGFKAPELKKGMLEFLARYLKKE